MFTFPKHKKTFRSRQSVLLIIILVATLIIPLIQMIRNNDTSGLWILSATILFVVLIFMGIRYTISDNTLSVKVFYIPAGKEKISDIKSIKRSYNPLSSPAASLKRLRIDYGANKLYMLISPANEKKFIDELKQINPNIKVSVSDKKGFWRIQDWDI